MHVRYKVVDHEVGIDRASFPRDLVTSCQTSPTTDCLTVVGWPYEHKVASHHENGFPLLGLERKTLALHGGKSLGLGAGVVHDHFESGPATEQELVNDDWLTGVESD